MLTRADDYPIHQRPEPVATAGSARNFYDRYFFNGYDVDRGLFFAAALGVYPHLNVMDAAFCVIVDGVQHNVHASRLLAYERLDTRVGPIEIEVVEPLRVLRVRCDDADNGIFADLTFHARAEALEEPRFTRRVGSMLMMDYTRLTQNGSWSGSFEAGGTRIEVEPDQIRGTRDRSWGIRPIGTGDPQQNPYAPSPQFYWLWCPCNFDDRIVHYYVNADETGAAWNTHGVVAPVLDAHGLPPSAPEPMLRVASDIDWRSGSRHADSARVQMLAPGDRELRLEVEPVFNFYMRGLGYGDPDWSHGIWKGELATGYDSFALDEVDVTRPDHFHIQAVSRVRLHGPEGTQEGAGILEQLVIGPYAPAGFRELADMAP